MDPVKVAAEYGLPWGIITGLALVIAYLYKTTVPIKVWQNAVDEKAALTDALQKMTGDVRTLLALQQRSGGDRS